MRAAPGQSDGHHRDERGGDEGEAHAADGDRKPDCHGTDGKAAARDRLEGGKGDPRRARRGGALQQQACERENDRPGAADYRQARDRAGRAPGGVDERQGTHGGVQVAGGTQAAEWSRRTKSTTGITSSAPTRTWEKPLETSSAGCGGGDGGTQAAEWSVVRCALIGHRALAESDDQGGPERVGERHDDHRRADAPENDGDAGERRSGE